MNALDLLTRQHRDVERLFDKIERETESQQYILLETLADLLTVHTTIEEQIFYPAVKSFRTQSLLADSVQDHLEAKRLASTLLDSEPEEGVFADNFKRLRKSVLDHVRDEENSLFPLVRQECDTRTLERLGAQMKRLAERVMKEDVPSERIPSELDRPAPI